MKTDNWTFKVFLSEMPTVFVFTGSKPDIICKAVVLGKRKDSTHPCSFVFRFPEKTQWDMSNLVSWVFNHEYPGLPLTCQWTFTRFYAHWRSKEKRNVEKERKCQRERERTICCIEILFLYYVIRLIMISPGEQ